MKRDKFITRSLLTATAVTASGIMQSLFSKHEEEIKPIEQVGFEHLPTKKSNAMANMILHRANERGHANHGWLNSYHSFSFASYYDPEKTNFGVLRVLNDDTVDPGEGFGTHPHNNMEIISIPLEGDLEHKDSMGNTTVIKQGDIQVMSAGTGVYHSEYNKNRDKQVKFLQIWVIPRAKGVKPRYDQITLSEADRLNKFQQIVSPNADDAGVWINQDAWFNLGKFDKAVTTDYKLNKTGNGVYAFLLGGQATINGQALNNRDAVGVWDTDKVSIDAQPGAEILLMEVPMEVKG
ncbi:MAG TPA: pirin family protein [Chitinophagales bacterium]|nr:pirin family protein [Chitinophagales bacterium]